MITFKKLNLIKKKIEFFILDNINIINHEYYSYHSKLCYT